LFESLAPVLKNRSFRNYFFGTIVSTVGDGMQFIGIAWMITQLTGTTSSMGWLLALTSVPGILFSPWIGVLVDRWDRRLICMGADLFRGSIITLIPLMYYLHSLQTWMLYAVVFLVSVGDRFYWPSSGGLVREIVPVEQLLSANSLSSMFLQMGALVGAGLGGIIIASFNPVLVMLINAVSFFISAGFTFFIRRGRYVAPRLEKKATGVYRDFLEGISYLKKHTYVVGIAVLQLFLFITLYTTNVLLPSFSMNVLKVGSTGFGFIDAAWAIGAIIGGIFLLSVIRNIGSERYVTPGMVLLGLSILVFLTSNGLTQAIIGYGLMGLFFVSTRINYDTIIQTLVPTEFQGRVKSTISMVISYVSLVIYLGVGYLGDRITIRMVYVGLAVIIMIGGILSIPISRIQRNLKPSAGLEEKSGFSQ
jgi:MFS family permease